MCSAFGECVDDNADDDEMNVAQARNERDPKNHLVAASQNWWYANLDITMAPHRRAYRLLRLFSPKRTHMQITTTTAPESASQFQLRMGCTCQHELWSRLLCIAGNGYARLEERIYNSGHSP